MTPFKFHRRMNTTRGTGAGSDEADGEWDIGGSRADGGKWQEENGVQRIVKE